MDDAEADAADTEDGCHPERCILFFGKLNFDVDIKEYSIELTPCWVEHQREGKLPFVTNLVIPLVTQPI